MDSGKDNIQIKYRFIFGNGEEREFLVTVNRHNLNLVSTGVKQTNSWAELNFCRCPNCSLEEKQYRYCPIALNLIDLIEFFKEATSLEMVDIVIETKERNYSKHTTLQSGLSSLMGIYMTTTGCPIMAKLKPMVRFHLPFASDEETKYRAITMYLMSQYFLYRKGKTPDWDLGALVKIYDEIHTLNKYFCKRLRNFKVEDASLNAVIILDCFANSVMFSISRNTFRELELLFKAYLD